MQLVAQGFFQRLGIDFNQSYSLVMDTTSFQFFLAVIVRLSLYIYLLDVVTAYLHGILVAIFLSPPSGFLPRNPSSIPGRYTSLKILKALYGLKQVGHI